MPPKRKRKTQLGFSYARKKKDPQSLKQNQEDEPQQEQEEEGLKRTPSCSSTDHDEDDDVCLISPPPNFKSNNRSNSTIDIITPSSGRKRGRKGRQILAHNSKDIDSVKSTIQLLVLPFDAHSCDLPKHEALFQKLGLFEFANLEFHLEPRVDLLAELLITYDPGTHSSFVRDLRIRVSRADLAKALRIPYKKEKNIVAVEVPDFEGPPGYTIGNCSAEGIGAVLKFVSTRVLPCDDPSMTWAEMVVMVENALKLEQTVDWASLIWSKAEAEIRQGKGLSKFSYGCHFLELIRLQRPGLFESDLAEIENEEESFLRTRSLDDLDGGDLGLQGNQEEGLDEKGEIGENEEKDVNGEKEQTDVSGMVMEQQEEENNKDGNEITRDDETEKHGDGGLLVEGTFRPCSTDVAEKNGDDEGGKDIEEVQIESGKFDRPTEVDSQGVHPEGITQAENIEQVQSEHEKVDGHVEADSQGVHLEGLTEADSNALSEFERLKLENNALSVLERGEGSDDACLANPKSCAEHPFPEYENGRITASDTHMEESIEEEAQFIKGGKDTVLTSTTHIEKPTSAQQMMSEIEKGVTMSADGLLQRSNTAEQMMMSEMDKDMALGLEMDLQRPEDNVFQLMGQGLSHSDTVRKRDMEEDIELHGDTGKKPGNDIPLSFDICMGNLYDWTRRVQASYVNEKEMIISRANLEIGQLTQQLQQRDILIRNLQMEKQEDQHRVMEVNKLKSDCFLTNKTFFGYVKALDDARDTIHQLRDIIRQQNCTMESLNGQLLQQKQTFMGEYQYLKEQISQFSNYMQESFDKLNTEVDKRMEQQASLEEKLETMKEEMLKKQSDPPA